MDFYRRVWEEMEFGYGKIFACSEEAARDRRQRRSRGACKECSLI